MKKKHLGTAPDDDEPKSPAYQLIQIVWQKTAFKSWIRLNHTMQEALSLALQAGLSFNLDDIKTIYNTMRGGRWFGDVEWIYKAAIDWGNLDAARSFESWRKREPFILDGRRLHVGAPVDLVHLSRKGGHGAMVTSFASDGESLIVCVYKTHVSQPKKGQGIWYPGGKPLHRIKLTLEEVRAIERARVKALKDAKKASTAA